VLEIALSPLASARLRIATEEVRRKNGSLTAAIATAKPPFTARIPKHRKASEFLTDDVVAHIRILIAIGSKHPTKQL
jgi:hypothetical protein